MIIETPARMGAGRERPALRYQSGFRNEHASEAVPGALPVGQNSPQRAPHGLYAELISGTAFTAPRAENLTHLDSTGCGRRRMHPPFARIADGLLRTAPVRGGRDAARNRLRWDPLPIPAAPTDFVEGLVTIAGRRRPAALQTGLAVHVYRAQPLDAGATSAMPTAS